MRAREARTREASALVSHQVLTDRGGEPPRILELPASRSAGEGRAQASFFALCAAGSRFVGRQIAVFLPIVLLHLGAFYAIVNNESSLSRALTPIIVRFVPLDPPTKPPDPPMLPAGALSIDNTLVHALPPQLEYDAYETFSTPAPSRTQAPITPEPVKEEVLEPSGDGPLIRPRPIRRPSGASRYPSGSIAAKESGRATITICIAATGKVDRVELAKSTGFERLDNSALNIARQYEFTPALRNGKPIPVCLPYTINYKLK